jgi:hypothetical protein
MAVIPIKYDASIWARQLRDTSDNRTTSQLMRNAWKLNSVLQSHQREVQQTPKKACDSSYRPVGKAPKRRARFAILEPALDSPLIKNRILSPNTLCVPSCQLKV